MRSLLLFVLLIPATVFAQFSDNFTDGDFSSNPAWSGNTSKFVVSAGQELQLYEDPQAEGISFLSSASEAIYDASWEFLVKMQFNPSGTNYCDVYLVSNNSDLSATTNGYFVRLGNTADEVSLYRKDVSTSTMIIDGTNSRLNTTAVNVRVKVTRDFDGNWTLQSDTLGGTDYYTEGATFDDNYFSSAFFGVRCVYTSTRSQHFFFDDIVVTGDPFVDDVAPELLSYSVIDNQHFLMVWNEALDETTTCIPENFLMNGGLDNPTSVTFYNLDNSKLLLEFDQPFTSPATYSMLYQGVTDVSMNVAASGNIEFSYIEFEPGMVVINEIMADPNPVVALPDAEYVELYNTTAYSMDLTDWTYTIGSTIKTLPSYQLAAGDYVILCHTDFVAAFDEYGNTLGITSFPTITNSGQTIVLKDNDAQEIDRVTYSDSWYQDEDKAAGGWSLEKIDPLNNCSPQSNWIASNNANGGSPGTINSVDAENSDNTPPTVLSISVQTENQLMVTFSERVDTLTSLVAANYNLIASAVNPVSLSTSADNTAVVYLTFADDFVENTALELNISGISDLCDNEIVAQNHGFFVYWAVPFDIVINEIMADPNPVIGLPDVEYVELYNTTDVPVDITNWTYTFGSTVKTLPACQIEAGEYLILCKDTYAADMQSYGNVLGVASFPDITNGGQTIILNDKFGNEIDKVIYSSSWYNDSDKEDGGWSLEKIDPVNTCSPSTNWTASENAAGGTPGIINSVYDTNSDTQAPFVSGVTVTSGNELTVIFSEPVDTIESLILTNYNLEPAFGNPFYAYSSPESTDIVILQFPASFSENVNYTLSVANIGDWCSNMMTAQNIEFMIYNAEEYDVIISEIMADPDPVVLLPEVEYIELYNRTDKNIDLTDWTISAGTTVRTIPNSVISANDYVVLCDDDDAALFTGIDNIIGVDGFPSLTNGGTVLTIKSKQGLVINTVQYSDSWYQDNFKLNGGYSLEIIDLNNPCEGENNWRATNDVSGGTPRRINSVNGTNPDEILPYPVAAEVFEPDTLVLYFSEILKKEFAENALNFSVDGIGNPVWISAAEPDYSVITMKFGAGFEQGELYYVNISDSIRDCVGNMVAINTSFRFGIADSVVAGDIIINEILFNPLSGGSDFVEIYNNSDKLCDLKNLWVINKDEAGFVDDTYSIADISRLLLPGEYCAISEDTQFLIDNYYVPYAQNLYETSSLPSLADDIGNIFITDRFMNVLDSVYYTDDQHYKLLASDDGVSLERINFERSSSDLANWHSASETAGFATPGYKNSQFSDEIVTETTITLNPEVFSPDNDGVDDRLEIIYKLEQPGYTATIAVYSADGKFITYIANNEMLSMEGTLFWDGFDNGNNLCPVGIYVIYVEMFNLTGNKVVEKHAAVLSRRVN